jgi:hypothetical protein
MGVGTSGRVEDIRKGCRKVNMYIQEYVCLNENGKMRPVTTILRKGKG